MAFDFAKLTTDVTAAMEAGQQVADATEDNGTCNMDGVLLRIPRIKEANVVAALAAAGVNTDKNNWGWHGIGYMINPPWGQAEKRSRACDAIRKHLTESGYEVSGFYMMD
jgi:hypothetical protein